MQCPALDQFSGICSQIADITVVHHEKLIDGRIPHDVAADLTGELHEALVALFILPAPRREPEDE